MNKLSKEKRDKLILVCIGIIAILGFLYTFVLAAQKAELAKVGTKITSVKGKLHKAEALTRSAKIISSNLAEGATLIAVREESMAPQGQYYYWFLKLIDQFRKDEKLDTGFITDITQPEFVDAGLQPRFPYKAASFGLRLNGHYHDIGRFIASVENSFPYFRVEDLKITPAVAAAAAGALGKQPLVPVENADEKLIVELRIVTLIRPGTT